MARCSDLAQGVRQWSTGDHSARTRNATLIVRRSSAREAAANGEEGRLEPCIFLLGAVAEDGHATALGQQRHLVAPEFGTEQALSGGGEHRNAALTQLRALEDSGLALIEVAVILGSGLLVEFVREMDRGKLAPLLVLSRGVGTRHERSLDVGDDPDLRRVMGNGGPGVSIVRAATGIGLPALRMAQLEGAILG